MYKRESPDRQDQSIVESNFAFGRSSMCFVYRS